MENKDTTLCKKCGGITGPSKALFNQLCATSEWNDNDLSGATFGASSEVVMKDCLKCENCGHSFILGGRLPYTTDQSKPKKIKCYNCKHASKGFKIGNQTHHQCMHPKHDKTMKKFEISPWDTLQEFWSSCNDHELKTNNL